MAFLFGMLLGMTIGAVSMIIGGVIVSGSRLMSDDEESRFSENSHTRRS